VAEPAAAAVLAELEGEVELVLDRDVLAGYRHDEADPQLLSPGEPLAAARPRSVTEVQAVVRAAARHGVPIVPRGAGSGLSGGANAVDGCLVLSLERMNAILTVDPAALTATVQPGVVNEELRDAVREHGLWYAPDPASAGFSTIGGNVATNAGGLCCVKYGVTRDWLLGLEAVLADGRLARLGRRTRKGVMGYDLASLFCGSEGTLGVITEVTVRLQTLPPTAGTVVACFTELAAAGLAIERIVRAARPSMLEIMDRATINAVEDYQPMDLDRKAAALLLARSDGPFAETEAIADLCEGAGADFVATSDEEAEGRMLLAARRLAYPALERRGAVLLDDVAVPLNAIVALIEGTEAIAAETSVPIATFGHAGDGNLHPTLVYDREDPAAIERAEAAFAAIVRLALRLGGTATGEHGVGLLKQRFLAEELDPPALDLQRAIKHAFDPASLLNPGKAVG
jgi:glycolate dehydrogenase FAD-linked subunit